ncbi:hypothetical protein E9993_16775 [Labilibacter sediminis]|nr:hypothetical protein E9993_16775 [Labilibacter sediminis]
MEKATIGKFVTCIIEEIQKKFGKEISYAKDCLVLSEEISTYTNRQVSVTTLKRFFGIVESQFNPSKFTLDTLSMYLDFNNWQDFINSFEKEKHTFSKEDSWDQLKKRARVVTDYSLQSMNTKVGNQITEFPLRPFAKTKIESFFKSKQLATAFIAPEGYGKTLLITQLVDKYFTGPDPKNPKDIICLIDGRILVKLLSLNIKVNRIYNLLEFDPKNSFSNYFRDNPEEVKGRFILIIDGINDIFSQAEKLNLFVDNLLKIVASYEHISWFKLIISCRPDNWQIFRYLMNKNPLQKAHWYDVSFEENIAESINVPLLEESEIRSILEYNHSPKSLDVIKFHFPEILDIINYPYFLHLFLEVQKNSNIYTDIELLYQYFHKLILTDPIAVEKLKLIDTFFKICDNARIETSVNKDDLLVVPEYEIAYKELLSAGIFHEYKVPGSYLSVQTFVEFTHNILLEFFLANRWLKENELNQKLLLRIITFYNKNSGIQCNIIKYIIKIAFKEEKTIFLRDIYSLFQMPNCKAPLNPASAPFHEIISVIGLELRKNKKVRDILIPWYAQSQSGQLFYFESFFDMDCLVLHSGDNMDYYLKYNTGSKAQFYGHFMKFMQYFLSADTVRCEEEYTFIRKLEYANNSQPLGNGLYFAVQIIYESVYLNTLSSDLLNTLWRKVEQIIVVGDQKTNSIPQFELSIIFALNYGNRFNEIIQLSDHIFKNYEFTRFEAAAHYQLFRAIYARALLNTGHQKKAKVIFDQVNFQTIPVNTRKYIELRYKLIKVEFLIADNQLSEALSILSEIKSVAHLLRFVYFYEVAEKMEKEASK